LINNIKSKQIETLPVDENQTDPAYFEKAITILKTKDSQETKRKESICQFCLGKIYE